MNTLKKILNNINLNSKNKVTGFVIGNTVGTFKNGSFYPIPIRKINKLIYGGVIVKDTNAAKRIAKMIDGKVDYIFVDAENKIKKNKDSIELAVRKTILKSKIISYKGNDLAAEAVNVLLAQLIPNIYNNMIAIIGCGNLGSKIALKLVERGAHVRVYRRDQKNLKKIVDGLNNIKSDTSPSFIKIKGSISEACKDAIAIIATANAKSIVNAGHLKFVNKNKPPILVDVGKGCFSDNIVKNDAYTVYRADISTIQKYNFSSLLETKLHYETSTGRRIMEDKELGHIRLASLGLLGRLGEIIVDDIHKPSQIIGISDGKGSLVKDIKKYKKTLDKVALLVKF